MRELSIVIVNWNTRELLLECLDSLREHLPSAWYESIVIDNGSSDDSCLQVRKSHPETTLVENEENLGFARANNIGLARSSAPYVLFINSDARLIDDSLVAVVEHAKTLENLGMLGARVCNPDGTLQDSAKGYAPTLSSAFVSFFVPRRFSHALHWQGIWDDADWASAHEVDWVTGAFLLMPRAAIDEVGGFCEDFFMYCEDIELCLRTKTYGRRVIYEPRVRVAHHRGKSMERQRGSRVFQASNSLIDFYGRSHGLLSTMVFAVIVRAGYALRMTAALRGRESRDRYLGKLLRALRRR